MLLQAVASSLCDGDGGGDDDDHGVDGDGGGEDNQGVNGDDDDTNLWVHLCIMGMASTSDSFVFIYFGAQHIRNTKHKTTQHTTNDKRGLQHNTKYNAQNTKHNTHSLQWISTNITPFLWKCFHLDISMNITPFLQKMEVWVKLSLKQSNLPRTARLKFANKST